MDADEYLKTVEPAGKPSRLKPFLADILKLREAKYTLEQVKDFLALNGVEISVSGLAAYLKRHDSENPKPEKIEGTAREKTANKKAVVNEKTQEAKHRPADLDKILGSKPDLDQLVRQSKRTKQTE